MYLKAIMKKQYEWSKLLIIYFYIKERYALIEINKHEIDLKTYLSAIVQNMKILGAEKDMTLVLQSCPEINVQLDTSWLNKHYQI